MIQANEIHPAPRGRKWARLAAAAVLLALAGAAGLVLTLDINRFKPAIEALGPRYTGLPLKIGTLSWSMTPLRVKAEDVTLGEGDARAHSPRVAVLLSFWPLLERRIAINGIVADALEIHLPAEFAEARARVEAVVAKARAGGGSGDGKTSVGIDLIQAKDFRIFAGERSAFNGNFGLHDVVSDNIGLVLEAAAPYFNPDARLAANMTFGGADAPWKGNAKATRVNLRSFSGDDNVPDTNADLNADFSGSWNAGVGMKLAGNFVSTTPGPLDGALQAELRIGRDGVEVSAAKWDSPGVKVDARGQYTSGKGASVAAPSVHLTQEGLAALAPLAGTAGIKFKVREGAKADVSGLAFEVAPSGLPHFAGGAVAIAGIDLELKDGTPALENIRGTINIADGALHVEELAAEGIKVSGEVTPNIAKASAGFNLSGEAVLSKARLGPFVDVSSLDKLSGTVVLDRLSGTLGGTMPPKDLHIAAHAEKLRASTKATKERRAINVAIDKGAAEFKDGTLTLTELNGDGFTLAGTLTPDLPNKRCGMDLSGSADLKSGLVRAFWPQGALRDPSGTVKIAKLRGTVTGAEIPADLAVEGSLDKVGLSIDTAAFADGLTNGNGTFKSNGAQVAFDLTAVGDRLGDVTAKGSYDLAKAVLDAKAEFDVTHCGIHERLRGTTREAVRILLCTYGQSQFAINAQFPSAGRDNLTLAIKKKTDPPIDAVIEAIRDKGGNWSLGKAHAETHAPIESLITLAPPDVRLGGKAAIVFTNDPGARAFQLLADLNGSSIGYVPYLEKRIGQNCAINLRGSSGAKWSLDAVEVQVLDEKIQMATHGDGFAANGFALDLRKWGPMLAEGRRLTGSVKGDFTTSPVSFDLVFDQTCVALEPRLGIDSLTGHLTFANGKIGADKLQIKGGGSDCVLDAQYAGAEMKANISGASLNLNSLQAMYVAAAPLARNFGARAEAASSEKPAPAKAKKPAKAAAKTKKKKTSAQPLRGVEPPLEPIATKTNKQVEPTRTSPAKAAEREAPQAAAEAAAALRGTARIEVGKLEYRRGYLSNFRGDVRFGSDGYTIENISVVPYSGSAAGRITVRDNPVGPRTIDINLLLDHADMRAFDDFVREEPLGLAGKMTGKVHVNMPIGVPNPQAGLNGSFDVQAVDGNLGKYGVGTRILATIRTAEIIRFRMPNFKDEGALFDTLVVVGGAKAGVVNLQQFDMRSASFGAEAAGTIDYPRDALDLHTAIHPFEAILGIANALPIVGQPIEKLRQGRGLQLRIVGSTTSPTPVPEYEPKILRDLTGTVTGSVGSVIQRFRSDR